MYPSLFNLQRRLRGQIAYAVTYTAREVLIETEQLQLPSPNEYRAQPNALSPETLRKREREQAKQSEEARTPHYAARLGPCWRAIREYRQSRWNRPLERRDSV